MCFMGFFFLGRRVGYIHIATPSVCSMSFNYFVSRIMCIIATAVYISELFYTSAVISSSYVYELLLNALTIKSVTFARNKNDSPTCSTYIICVYTVSETRVCVYIYSKRA